jgi:hypothetical protein
VHRPAGLGSGPEPSREAMKKVCAEPMTQFGQASKVKCITLAEMAKRYGSA